MRIIYFIILILVSCETDNCDLSEYPSSPLSEPYAVQYRQGNEKRDSSRNH